MIRIASPWASCQALGFVEAGLPGSGGYRVGVVVVLGVGGWWWSPGGLVLDGGVHVDGGVGRVVLYQFTHSAVATAMWDS